MATVTNLVDYICDVLKFAKGTAGSPTAERTRALNFLNIVAPEVIMECEVNEKLFSVSLTAGQGDLSMLAAPFAAVPVLMFNDLWLTDSSNVNVPLSQVEPGAMRQLRQGIQAPATPYVYSVMYPDFYLFPSPQGVTTLAGEYVAMPLTMVESGGDGTTTENTPTCIHPAFHYSVLANAALVRAFEYDDPGGFMSQYMSILASGKQLLTRWNGRMGGIEPPPWYEPGSGGAVQSVPSQDMGMFS